MARDGENGADGPPVLEFVWGRRVFGPCVIQNIRVRERSWDSGILVNAEVSFDLEQVPEWTINDGFVDVLRPGRQPTVNDPTLPRGSYDQSQQRDEENPANRPGGNNPGPNDIRYCKSLDWHRKEVNDRIYELEKLKNKPLSVVTQRGSQQGRPISNSDKISKLWRGTITPQVHYNNSLDTEMNEKIKRISSSSFCNFNPSENGYSVALEEANRSTSGVTGKIKNVDNYYTDRAISCLRQFKDIYTQEFSDKKCSSSPYRTPTGIRQGPGLF
jgi:hypothetical protein